jgi:NTE family protein
MHSLTLLTHRRLVADVALYADQVDLVVLPPPCPLRVSPIDFGQARDLIRAAHQEASRALRREHGRRVHPDREVGMHRHVRSA